MCIQFGIRCELGVGGNFFASIGFREPAVEQITLPDGVHRELGEREDEEGQRDIRSLRGREQAGSATGDTMTRGDSVESPTKPFNNTARTSGFATFIVE